MFDQQLDYLRVSLTARCNLNCTYCRDNSAHGAKAEVDLETLERFIDRAVRLWGIKKIRLTGGEPLLREGIEGLIQRVSSMGVDEVSLTTNGTLLSERLETLATSGLKRINVSLDTLHEPTFRRITAQSLYGPADVIRSIEEAKRLFPLKLNTILLRGINDGEIVSLVRFALKESLHIRFIECMQAGMFIGDYVASREVQEAIRKHFGKLKRVENHLAATEKLYSLHNIHVGFISPHTRSFCSGCNRLRISASGNLYLCIYSQASTHISELISKDDFTFLKILEGCREEKDVLRQRAKGKIAHMVALGG